MGEDRVLGLFKFGKRCYVEQFVSEGHLYMNLLSHFAELEGNAARGDKDEGASHSWQPKLATLSVKIDGDFKAIPGICGPIVHRNDSDPKTNVFCMYALRAGHGATLVDPRNFDFGDTYAVLTHGDEFLRRVEQAATEAGHRVRWKLVEYVERSGYQGPMGPFRKFRDFSYQSEFRIAVLPGTGSQCPLRVGDLSEIARIGNLREINDNLRLTEVE